MVQIRMRPNFRQKDIDLPETIAHRSGGNTIILVPGQSQPITEEEWAYIKTLPGVAAMVDELPAPQTKAAAAR